MADLAAWIEREVAPLIARCRAGERLIKTHAGAAPAYALDPSNDAVDPSVAGMAIYLGWLRPAGDGLLDAASSQVWTV